MAKKKIKVTDAMAAEAEPYVVAAVASKMSRIGAKGPLKRFRDSPKAQRRTATRAYQGFLDDGGKVGDFQSFMEWLISHADEIIGFISKIIALFAI